MLHHVGRGHTTAAIGIRRRRRNPRTPFLEPAQVRAALSFLQPNERGCIRGGLAVSDEGEQLPAPGFDQRRRMAGTLA